MFSSFLSVLDGRSMAPTIGVKPRPRNRPTLRRRCSRLSHLSEQPHTRLSLNSEFVRKRAPDCQLINTRLPDQDQARGMPRETNGRVISSRPRLKRACRHATVRRLQHKKPTHAEGLANITKPKPKRSEIQGGVRTEITELPLLAGSPTRPNRRLSDAITKANRSQ